jgi:hypothetical protein
MRVLICDDQLSRCADVTGAISKSGIEGIEIEQLIADELSKAVKDLFKAVRPTLDGSGSLSLSNSPFQTADLILIDNNLAHLNIDGARLTAESIAGYVRTVSSAYIVSLNKNPEVDFDLRYLIGDYSTRADIALNSKHLENGALWSGGRAAADGELLAWYWPTLCDGPQRRRDQIAWLAGKLDDKVVSAFTFSGAALDSLSRHARGVIAPSARPDGVDVADGPDLSDVTFTSFLESSGRSLPLRDDRVKLIETTDGKNVAYNTLAADLEWWFRRDVIGPQETLVDVPHLLMRMPFLLGSDAPDIEKWKAAVFSREAPYGMDTALYAQYVKPHLFPHGAWAPRPVFWWPHLRDNDELNKLFSSSQQQWADVVFCEDISTFVEREAAGAPAREFVAEFDSPWDRRYVKQVSGFKYAPRSRFAV